MPSLYEIVSTNLLFQNIPEQILRKLITECREESFGRDQIIFKEGDRVNEALIITRGGGSEFTDKLNNKLKEKRMLGDVAPIYMLVAPSIRYHTTFIADCVMNATFFKIATLQKIMKQVPAFEEQVYKHSLELLSKIYSEQLAPLCYFNRTQVQSVINHCTWQRHKKNSIIKIEQGCILLRGTLVDNSNLQEVSEEQSSDNGTDIVTKTNTQNLWKRDAICIVPPINNNLKCLTFTLMLVFKSF